MSKPRRIESKTKPESLLFSAVREDNLPLVTELLLHGENIDQTDEDGNTPLIIACKKNFMEIAEFLIANGANVDVVNNEGNNALLELVYKNNYKIIQYLIENRQVSLQTPLMIAAQMFYYQSVMVFISGGANFWKKDTDGKTALDLAIESKFNFYGQKETLAILKACQDIGKRVLKICTDDDFNLKNFRSGLLSITNEFYEDKKDEKGKKNQIFKVIRNDFSNSEMRIKISDQEFFNLDIMEMPLDASGKNAKYYLMKNLGLDNLPDEIIKIIGDYYDHKNIGKPSSSPRFPRVFKDQKKDCNIL